MQIPFKQSPNCSQRVTKKLGFVLHGTLGNYGGSVDWLLANRPDKPTSAHYIFAKDGRAIQIVKNEHVAYHCGTIRNPLHRAEQHLKRDPITGKYINPNEYLIGIEFEWFEGDTLTEAQYQLLMQVVKDSGIHDPIFVDHHSVCDYKSDDMFFAVQEISNRLARMTQEASQPVKPATVITLTPIKKPVVNFGPAMQFGERNSDIVWLQMVLQYEQCLPASYKPTGIYDQQTADAVLALQIKNKIAPLSDLKQLAGKRVGPLTIKYLNKIYGY